MTQIITLSSLSHQDWQDFAIQVRAAWPVGKNADGHWVLSVANQPPIQELNAVSLVDVKPVIMRAEAAAARGQWVVCSLAYEAAPAFDPALTVKAPSSGASLATYQAHETHNLCKLVLDAPPPLSTLEPWLAEGGRDWFNRSYQTIQECIARGDFYQINLTDRLHTQPNMPSGSAQWFEIFCHLFVAQPVSYAIYVEQQGNAIVSLSPELFFELNEGRLTTQPMKGTRAASANWPDKLSDNPKDRAENVMIVDLLRNDMARVCKPRTVQVKSLFDVMALPTVEQMTSTIEGELTAGCTLFDVFAALFPCGSVTGAPKAQAMLQIAQTECSPRGIYCGALGLLYPGGRARFNVPIRTVQVLENKLTYGVGSGITWYSSEQGEYTEWQQKTRFLRHATTDFCLLETVKLSDGQWVRQEAHLARMRDAATHFNYVWHEGEIYLALQEAASKCPLGLRRGRWLLNCEGNFVVELHDMPERVQDVTLVLAEHPFQATGPFVGMKTTWRPHYDAFMPRDVSVFDTLLWNTQGAITETCRANVVLSIHGRLLTPKAGAPKAGNLLCGVFRNELLRENTLEEKVLTLDDLANAERMWVINSLREWTTVARVVNAKGEVVIDFKTA